MKSRNKWIAISSLGLVGVILAACSAQHQGQPSSENATQTTQALDTASKDAPAPPKREVIRVDTVPFAQCTLTGGSSTDVVEADENGHLRFYTPPASWGDHIAVDCQPSKRTLKKVSTATGTSHRLSLADRSTFTTEPEETVEHVKGVRPALAGDPLALSDNELLHRGYPRRPDPTANPKEYSRWLDQATRETKIIDVKPVANLGIHNAQFQGRVESNNWAGPVLENGLIDGTTQYDYAVMWTSYAPVNGHSFDVSNGFPSAKMSYWAGLGGWNDQALIQDGVVLNNNGTTVAWYEYFQCCNNSGGWAGPEMDLTGFTVGSSDLMGFYAYVGDSVGNLDAAGGYGWFLIQNLTRDTDSGWQSVEAQTGQHYQAFGGRTAEFIAERPADTNLTPYPLDAYGDMVAEGYAYDTTSNVAQHSDATDDWFFAEMVNPSDNTLLTECYFPGHPDNSNQADYEWIWHGWQ